MHQHFYYYCRGDSGGGVERYDVCYVCRVTWYKVRSADAASSQGGGCSLSTTEMHQIC